MNAKYTVVLWLLAAQVLAGPLPVLSSGVPTAEELSGQGKLQAYYNECVSAGVDCLLPSGVIKTDGLNVYYATGVRIIGTGRAFHKHDSKNGWRSVPWIIRNNTTLVSTNSERPLITLKPVKGIKIQGICFDTTGIGVHYRAHLGWGPSHINVTDCSFIGCEAGFKAGDNVGDANAADAHFEGCSWHDCRSGLLVMHQQGVNYTLEGQCWFYDTDVAIHLKGGGFVVAPSLHGFGVKTWCKVERGGPNLVPQFVCGAIYSDRSPPSRPPVLIDATLARDVVKATVGIVKITDNSKDIVNKGHKLFLAPFNEDVAAKSELSLFIPDLSSWPRWFDARSHKPSE